MKGRRVNNEIPISSIIEEVIMRFPLMLSALAIGFTWAVQAAEPAPSTPPTKETYLRIADEVEANLQKEILDKFFPVTVDEQGGGFYENYSLNWTRTAGGNKSIVYQSRLTWTSAEAARRFPAKADLYLAMTRRGAACLADKLWDKTGGGFYWQVGPNGQPTLRHQADVRPRLRHLRPGRQLSGHQGPGHPRPGQEGLPMA